MKNKWVHFALCTVYIIFVQKRQNVMSNKIYPIGIQNFESLREDGYFYVDKTAWVYQLIHTGRYYFLSRPRRFGKSLLLSTIEAYMQGKKELFKGLAIEQLEKDWTTYPILHIDLNIEKYDSLCPYALPALSAVPASRPESGWSFWWTSMTSPCCRPSATRRCRKNSATR